MNINLTFIQQLQNIFKKGFIQAAHDFAYLSMDLYGWNSVKSDIVKKLCNPALTNLCELIREHLVNGDLIPGEFVEIQANDPIVFFMKSKNKNTRCFLTVQEAAYNYINIKAKFAQTHIDLFFETNDDDALYYDEPITVFLPE